MRRAAGLLAARLALVAALAPLAIVAVAVAGDGDDKAAPPAAPAAPVPELKIEVVTKGEGREIKGGDIVLAHLVIALADGGKVLLDTRPTGEARPLMLGMGTVVPGLEQALLKMRQGDRWKLVAPWQLAFGESGIPGRVPPRSDIAFDVEVVGFLDVKTEVLASGSGPLPAVGDFVVVHYVGTLLDGKQFDTSREKQAPLVVPLGAGAVIPGWEVALRRMKVGDRVKVTIPWQLAYGLRGRPPQIPSKADLVFDIERLPLPELKTEVLAEGKGAQCKPGQTVSVHYTGTLTDGTEFDSSRAKKEPLPVVLGRHGVIAGWELALAKMRVGDRWKVTIPWLLAYGAEGRPPMIPAKADLVFDMEVMDAR